MSNSNSDNYEMPVHDQLKHIKKMLKKGEGGGSVNSSVNSDGLELAAGAVDTSVEEADLSDSAIKERLGSAKGELNRIIKNFLGDKPELYETAKKILSEGDEAFCAVRTKRN